jgi:hypothetical protein
MTLPQRRFGDPLQVLLRAEAETCKGCVHTFTKNDNDYCGNALVRQLLADKRCDEYEEPAT